MIQSVKFPILATQHLSWQHQILLQFNIHVNYSVVAADKNRDSAQRNREQDKKKKLSQTKHEQYLCACVHMGIDTQSETEAHSEMDVVAQRLSLVTSEIFIPAADQVSTS